MGRHRKLCACGCGEQVRVPRNTWLVGHIPRSQMALQRAAASRAMVFKVRSARFRKDLDRLGRQTTREDLLTLMATVYERGYQAGYHAAKKQDARAA